MAHTRRATRDDVPKLLPLIAEYWRFEGIEGFERENISAALGHLLTAPSIGAAWIADNGDVAVGYLLAVYVFNSEHRGLTAEIDEFFVLSDRRNSGVGSGLLQAAELEFSGIGCTNVSLQLSKLNDTARAFYCHRGYKARSKYELLEKTP